MGSVTYNFTYQTVFADSSTIASFVANLTSMAKVVNIPAGPQGATDPSQNPYFNSSSTNVGTVSNTFYDANKVEAFLNGDSSFGSSPIPGYTLFVADLHAYVPSLTTAEYNAYFCSPCTSPRTVTIHPHYYNITVTDSDLGLVRPRPFMTGWGGTSRSSFIDLSAGPTDVTGEPPLQVAQAIRTVGPATYLLTWRTQYIADYVAGAVFNLFGPDQLYPINYSAKYAFHLFVIDARPFGSTPAITSTVNIPLIKTRLASLVPFANISVTTQFSTLASDPALSKVISDATSTVFDSFSNDTIIDARPVYNWLSLEGHLSHYINSTRTTQQIDIPEFIFAFGGSYEFAFTFKSDLFQRASPDSIFGVSLGDLVLIGHSQADFTIGNYYGRLGRTQPGKGVGFTDTIIHESGHELGLVHPFSYDLDENFVNSVMSYYPGVNVYSQFDRDLELRGINDELLIFAQVTIAGASSSLLNSGSISAAQAAMATAEQKYSTMDYEGAVSYSLIAAQDAASAQAGVGILGGFSGGLYIVLGILIGTAIGILLGFLVFRKKTTGGLAYYRCPTCNRALRWDPAMGRWYCDYCQKPV